MIIILFLYSILCFLGIYYSYKKYGFSPVLIFLVMQFIMFIGIFFLVDQTNIVDIEYLIIYLLSLMLFILGTKINEVIIKKSDKNYTNVNLIGLQRIIIVVILIISIIVCIYFFSKTPNLFILILKNILDRSNINISDMRVNSYSTIGIGYVYQFRVIILPFIVAYLISCERSILKLIGIISFPLMLIFILGTGQRGGFAIFSISWLIALLNLNRYNKSKKYLLILLSIFSFFTLLFVILTIYNGRSADSGGTINAILQRMFIDNQNASIVAFRYVKTLPTQYGVDWFNMFIDLLPGKNSYLPLANRVNAILYGGSTRGTAPPCIWTSTFYNWGYFGLMLFPIMLGYFYQNLTSIHYSRTKSKINIFIYSFMSITLGFWIADSPMALFNDGFISLSILYLLLNYTIYIDKFRNLKFGRRLYK